MNVLDHLDNLAFNDSHGKPPDEGDTWRTADGRYLLLKEMDAKHLVNSFNYMSKKLNESLRRTLDDKGTAAAFTYLATVQADKWEKGLPSNQWATALERQKKTVNMYVKLLQELNRRGINPLAEAERQVFNVFEQIINERTE